MQQFKRADDIPDNKTLSMKYELRNGKLSVHYNINWIPLTRGII